MKQGPQNGKALVIWLIIALALAGGVMFLTLQQPPPPPILKESTWLPKPTPLTDFELVDHNGKPFTLAQFKGKWSLVFLGYTHCPDVCPTTMNDLNGMSRVLGQDYPAASMPQVVFVSVDPQRDTPERLKSYVPYFNEQFLGVTGEAAQIADFSRQLHGYYRYVKDTPDSPDYLVDHSAAVSLIDPEGQLHALFTPPLNPRDMAQDYVAITNFYEASH